MVETNYGGLSPAEQQRLLGESGNEDHSQAASNNLASEAWGWVEEHPVTTAIGAGALGLAIYTLSRGRGGPVLGESVLAASGKAVQSSEVIPASEIVPLSQPLGAVSDAAVRPLAAVGAGDGSRAMIETGPSVAFNSGESIPDVLRPYLQANSVFSAQKMTEIGESYRGTLGNISQLSRSLTAQAGDTAGSVAERLLKERTPITGERITPELIAKETTRLQDLNPSLKEVTDWGGQSVTTYSDESLTKVSSDAMFKHVPPIGQFLKATGKVTQEQIDQAFELQKGMAKDAPRRFLGQIMSDQGWITDADADAADATRSSLIKYLGSILKEVTPSAPKA